MRNRLPVSGAAADATADGQAQTAGAAFDTPIDDIYNMPGHLLRRCHQIAVAVFLQECRAFDLTPLQYGVLVRLAHYGPMDQVTLAGLTALDRTTVAVVLKKLAQRGLAGRRRSDSDRRSMQVGITAQGLDLLARAQPAAEAAQARIVAPLSAQERTLLVRLLSRIARENNALSRAPQRMP